ncbi:MAG: hypothetical protein GY839_20295 [candidate division Zixibacteria bacterium]|nr:hypothetical protein [candidate division Zixibacteria bacterium]
MNLNNQNDSNLDSCCGGADCGCNTPSSGSANGKGWRTFIFTAVILLAVGVTGYSLISKKDSASSGCAPGTACGIDGICAIPCDTTVLVTVIDKKLAEADFIMAVFLDTDMEILPDIAKNLESVTSKIQAMGKRALTLIIHPGDPGYQEAASKYYINSLPTLLTLGENGATVLTWDNISTGNLMLEFYRNCPSTPSTVSQSN